MNSNFEFYYFDFIKQFNLDFDVIINNKEKTAFWLNDFKYREKTELMPGGDKKIHEHPNANSNGFAQRPHEAGRKKKNYTEHIEDIKKKGYTAPTKSQYYEMVGLLLSMEEDDLKDFAKDKSRPYWIRLIIIDLNSKQTRQRIMSDYRDWLFGKATQYNENNNTHKVEGFDITKLYKSDKEA